MIRKKVNLTSIVRSIEAKIVKTGWRTSKSKITFNVQTFLLQNKRNYWPFLEENLSESKRERVCMRERESWRERKRVWERKRVYERESVCERESARVCVCVCVRERERERERKRERECVWWWGERKRCSVWKTERQSLWMWGERERSRKSERERDRVKEENIFNFMSPLNFLS